MNASNTTLLTPPPSSAPTFLAPLQLACQKCGAVFESRPARVLGIVLTARVCESCVAEEEARQRRMALASGPLAPEPGASRRVSREMSRDEEFVKLATRAGFAQYLRFDESRLLPAARAEWSAMVEGLSDLEESPEVGASPLLGYLLLGAWQRGKTFCGVALARRLHRAGASVRLVDAIEFGAAMGQPDNARRDAEIQACLEVDWLLFDDLGKMAMTPRACEGLFRVAKRRIDAERPTIWTSNADGPDLMQRMPAEFGGPFVDRLATSTREFLF